MHHEQFEQHDPRETVLVYAAGSLRKVLPVLVAAFTAATGTAVTTRHGPAGLLRERIEAGERPDLFLSANFAHPARLAEIGLALPPVLFARNSMAAIVRRDASITTANFIDRVLAPGVTIATSTPMKDPSGDYAYDIFRRIEALRPGAFPVLDAKAQKLVGAAEPTHPSGNYDAIAEALQAGQATLFLGYRTGLEALAAELGDIVEIVAIPDEVNVEPQYALAALNDCSRSGLAFALFILSAAGQKLLAEFGFRPVTPA